MDVAPVYPAPVQPASPHPAPVRAGIGVWLRDLIISLAISAFIIIFLYQPVKVEGTSMMPSLEDQERIFVNKFVYRWNPSSAATSWFSAIRAILRRATSSA